MNNDKRPSKHSKKSEEKTLGMWIGTQLNNYKNNIGLMKDEQKRSILEKLIKKYPKWFDISIILDNKNIEINK